MTTREKRTVFIGLGVVVVAVLLNLVLRPGLDAWQAARGTIAQHELQLENLEGQLADRDIKRRQLAQKYGPAVSKPLVTVSEARVAFPEAVQNALKRGGLGVSTVTLQNVRRVREVPGVSLVSLRVEGGTQGKQLADVLASLRASEVLALVEDLRIERGDGGGPDGAPYTLSFVLSTPALTEDTP